MKVRDLITHRKVVRIAPRQTALEAARLMVKARVGALLVTQEDGSAAGIFTERDLMVRVVAAEKDPARTLVEDVMTRDLYTTDVDHLVLELREELRARHIRHVPVVERGEVIAMLSMRDLVRAALEETKGAVKEMQRYIQGEEFA
jgi:signal-transduction protein with cAMP-binding, CBS, and nucleotidyltransferase domain